MEYSQTLKVLVTPAGRRYLAHTASAHRTSASDSGGSLISHSGYPTPVSNSHKQSKSYVWGNLTLSGAADLMGYPTPRAEDSQSSGERVSRGTCDTLTSVARLAGWGSPGATDHKGSAQPGQRSGQLSEHALLAGYPTPDKSAGEGSRMSLNPLAKVRASGAKVQQTINDVAQLVAGYPTPRTPTGGAESRESKDDRGSGGVDLQTVALGITTSSSRVPTAKRGVLNPALARWLMGYPPVWCACAVTATPSCRNSRRSGSKSA